jgi:hypothetical protein
MVKINRGGFLCKQWTGFTYKPEVNAHGIVEKNKQGLFIE